MAGGPGHAGNGGQLCDGLGSVDVNYKRDSPGHGVTGGGLYEGQQRVVGDVLECGHMNLDEGEASKDVMGVYNVELRTNWETFWTRRRRLRVVVSDIPLGDGLGTTKTNWIRKETVSFAIDLPISVMNRDLINKIRN